jgi:hypothetical protein
MNPPWAKIERFAPLALLVLAPLILFWRLLFAGEVLYWGVPLVQFYPWHSLVNQALAGGQLPLWTDLLGGGAPLLANHQTALFYPPNLLFRLVPVERALGYSLVLHIAGAGLAAYYWGGTLGLGRLGRTVTALSYALGGYVVGRTQFITMVAAYAWLPLLLALTERLVRRRNRLSPLWLGGALALQFLAGHAQIWFYSLLLVVAYGVYRCLVPPSPQPSPFEGEGAAVPSPLRVQGRTGAMNLEVGFRVPPSPQPSPFEGEGAAVPSPRRGEGGVRGEPGGIARISKRTLALFAPKPGRGKAWTLGSLGLGVLLSLALSAIQLLPTAELVLNSGRSGGTDWNFAMTYSFWPWRLLTLVAPDLFGNPALGNYAGYANYWEDAAYIGLLPLLFAAVALVHWLKSLRPLPARSAARSASVVPFFAALLPLAVVLAMGQNTPVFPLVFKYIPGFGYFQAPARLMLWFAVAASTLAGIGAHNFRLTYWWQYTLRLTVAGALAMLAVALLVGRAGVPLGEVYLPAVTRLAVTLGLAAGLLLLRGRDAENPDRRVASSALPRPAWGPLVAGTLAVDLLWFGMPLTPAISAGLYRLPNPAAVLAREEMDESRFYVDPVFDYDTLFKRYFSFDAFHSPDLAYWRPLRESLLPDLNAVDGIPALNNNEPLVIGRWQDLMTGLAAADWPAQRRLLATMGVGYLLADSAPPGASPVAGVPHLYRLPDTPGSPGGLPRAWVVAQARIVTTPGAALSELMAPTFDPAAQVLLEASRPSAPPAAVPGDGSTSRVASLREGWNRRTIDLVVARPGYLVAAYTYYPGWSATVDGRPAEIVRADYALLAVPVEAGQHRVELTYRPLSFIVGATISGLAVLATIGLALKE